MPRQKNEQVELLGREVNRRSRQRHAALGGPDRQRPRAQRLVGVLWRAVHLDAAEQRRHAREHLANGERLGDVVVGADLQSGDAVGLGVAGCQHQDGHGASGLAELAADVGAGEAGQHPVQHESIVGARQRPLERQRPIADDFHLVPHLGEMQIEKRREVAVVFDDEHGRYDRHRREGDEPGERARRQKDCRRTAEGLQKVGSAAPQVLTCL